MAMPDPGASLHNASLDYYCTFGEVAAAAGPVTFSVPDPVRFHFGFETGSVQHADGTVTVAWDYSWFSQAAQEAGITTALNQICVPIAAMLGRTVADIQAVARVLRVWTLAPNVQGQGAGSGRTVLTSVMPYP
jgi:hypothetical protein